MLHRLAKEGTLSQVENYLWGHPAVITQDDLANALSAAVMRGDLAIVKVLLAHSANPNCQPSEHLPALHCAIEQQDKNSIRLLVEYGADVNLPTENGFTPLHLAVDIEGDSAWQRGETPSVELTTLLLELGANPKAKDSSGKTPLNIAEQYQHSRAIELLAER